MFTLVREHESDSEIDGNFIPFHDGRCTDYNFEPSYLRGHDQEYWDAHWEQIEEDILKAFYNQKQAI